MVSEKINYKHLDRVEEGLCNMLKTISIAARKGFYAGTKAFAQNLAIRKELRTLSPEGVYCTLLKDIRRLDRT